MRSASILFCFHVSPETLQGTKKDATMNDRWLPTWVCVLSRLWLFATPWTVAHQATPSMGFSRQEYWGEKPFPSPGIFLTQGRNSHLLHLVHLQADTLSTEPPGKSNHWLLDGHVKRGRSSRSCSPGWIRCTVACFVLSFLLDHCLGRALHPNPRAPISFPNYFPCWEHSCLAVSNPNFPFCSFRPLLLSLNPLKGRITPLINLYCNLKAVYTSQFLLPLESPFFLD